LSLAWNSMMLVLWHVVISYGVTCVHVHKPITTKVLLDVGYLQCCLSLPCLKLDDIGAMTW